MDIRIDFFKKEKVIQILKTVGAALAPLLLLSLRFPGEGWSLSALFCAQMRFGQGTQDWSHET
jgi:hypothetical protein